MMTSSHRPNALRTAVGLALMAGVLLAPGLAQAKLLEPTWAGPLSNGSFSGLPIRADETSTATRRPVEVVGENCYVVQRQAKSAGRVVAYREAVCE